MFANQRCGVPVCAHRPLREKRVVG
jgi:hypothetical protein